MNYVGIPEKREIIRNRNKARRALSRVALSLVFAGAIASGIFGNGDPVFSENTHEVTIGQNEGLWYAASTVDGVNEIDRNQAIDYIEDMPENANTLSDGLQAGEIIEVPDSVEKP